MSLLFGGLAALGSRLSRATDVQTKQAPYQSGSPYDSNAPAWDSSGMPVGRMPRGDYALDYQYEANRRAEQRRQALWGDSQGALQQGADLMQMYRPGGASALASGIFSQQASMYGTQALNTVAPDMLIGWREDERQKALAEEQRRYNRSQANFRMGMFAQALMPLSSGVPQPGGDSSTGSNQVGSADTGYGQPNATGLPPGQHLSDGGPVPAVQSAYGGGEVPGALPSTLGPDAAVGGGGAAAGAAGDTAVGGALGGGAGAGALGAVLGAVTGGAGAAIGGGALGGAGTGAAASGAAGGAAAGAGAGAAAGGAAGGMSAAGASGLGSGIAGGNVGLTSFSGADVAQAAGRIAPVGQNSAIMDYASQPYSQELTRMMQQSAFDRLAAARSPTLVRPMSGYRTGGGF